LTAQQLFTWRRLAREGRLGGSAAPPIFAPVVVGDASVRSGSAAGRIEIVLAQGQRIIVDKDVDGAALARVVAVLAGR
jgi:transposase